MYYIDIYYSELFPNIYIMFIILLSVSSCHRSGRNGFLTYTFFSFLPSSMPNIWLHIKAPVRLLHSVSLVMFSFDISFVVCFSYFHIPAKTYLVLC
jgi:hypothetical protein